MNFNSEKVNNDLENSLERKWLGKTTTPKKQPSIYHQITGNLTKNSQHTQIYPNTSNKDLNQQINIKLKDLTMLSRCIRTYCMEQFKSGKRPWLNVIKMIEAFNQSQIKVISIEISRLISKIIKTLVEAQSSFPQQESSKEQQSNNSNINMENQISFSGQNGQQNIKTSLMIDINNLQESLQRLRQEKNRIKQAKDISIRMTRYEKAQQIIKLKNIIKQQEKMINRIEK